VIPENKWKWFGNAAHLCVSNWCRFHMAKQVGNHVISTVGEYYPPHKSERECPDKPTTIGCDRVYETMVFKVEGECGCGCGLPMTNGSELDFAGYNDPKEAAAGHMQICKKWSRKK